MNTVFSNYQIVFSDNVPELEKKVRDQLYLGWMPHGSMSIAHEGDEWRFYQPMIAMNDGLAHIASDH